MTDLPIQSRHLIVCRKVHYDPFDHEAPYSLESVFGSIRPHDSYGYPFCVEELWLFTQVFGEPGRYEIDIHLARLELDGADSDDPPVLLRDGVTIRVRPNRFVEGARFRVNHVLFPEPGLYEFRLTIVGTDQPLASERIYLQV